MAASSSLLFVLSFAVILSLGSALQFDVPPVSIRCLGEEISKSTLVVGDVNSASTNMVIRVFDPSGNTVFNKANTQSAKFAFTATESGNHQFCVDNVGAQEFRARFDVKIGAEAKDYSEVAKKENLKPIEVELRKLEDVAGMIHNEFVYMREREEAMRNTNESTHDRVIGFSIFTILVVVGLGGFQAIYLKQFFRAKKLI